MRVLIATAACAFALLLAGCGGSGKHASSTPAASTVTQPATAPTATSPPTTASTTTTRTTGPSASATLCTAAKLAGSFIGQQGATGHGEIAFALRNTSSTSCHTFGYPGVLFLNRGGGALATVSTRTTHDFAGAAPLQSLTLAPGGSASFRLIVTHGINSTVGCSTAYGVQVIPPDDTATLRISIPGGAYQCRTTTVTPLQPGTSAYR